jgi:DNA invertase Pin-like site-specific DNA recombinase
MTDSKPKGSRSGYARESTDKQEAGLAAQRKRLKAAGCTEVFEDLGQSGATNLTESPEWARLDAQLVAGDELVVTSQSRLGRKSYEVTYAVGKLIERGVVVTVLDDNRTYDNLDIFEQNLMLGFNSSKDHNERVVNKERQAAARQIYDAAGMHWGRKPILSEKDVAVIKDLYARGMTDTGIGKILARPKRKGGPVTPLDYRTVQKARSEGYVTIEQWERDNAAAYTRIGQGVFG